METFPRIPTYASAHAMARACHSLELEGDVLDAHLRSSSLEMSAHTGSRERVKIYFVSAAPRVRAVSQVPINASLSVV